MTTSVIPFYRRLHAGRVSATSNRSPGRIIEAARLVGGDAVDVVADILAETSRPLARVPVLRALGHLDGERALVGLLDGLFADTPVERLAAAQALSERGAPAAAIPGMVAALVVGGAASAPALTALEDMPRDADAAILRALTYSLERTDSPAARQRLVEALAALEAEPARALLVRIALDGGEPTTVRAAAVRRLSDGEVGRRVAELGIAARSADRDLRVATVEALADCRRGDSLEVLEALLEPFGGTDGSGAAPLDAATAELALRGLVGGLAKRERRLGAGLRVALVGDDEAGWEELAGALRDQPGVAWAESLRPVADWTPEDGGLPVAVPANADWGSWPAWRVAFRRFGGRMGGLDLIHLAAGGPAAFAALRSARDRRTLLALGPGQRGPATAAAEREAALESGDEAAASALLTSWVEEACRARAMAVFGEPVENGSVATGRSRHDGEGDPVALAGRADEAATHVARSYLGLEPRDRRGDRRAS